jgi:flagellar motor switch/type III secretory pathway protein FliN
MIARPIHWPGAARVPTEAPPLVADQVALAAALGPELTRLAGFRVSAALAEAGLPDAPLTGCGRIALARGQPAATLIVACPADHAALLLERLFGGRAADAAAARGASLAALPPGSASWIVLCRTLCAALVRALERGGLRTTASPALPPRAAPIAAAGLHPALLFQLDADGSSALLALLPEAPARDEPRTEAPDAAAFRQRARARALELELPVSLRIAEQRIPLGAVSALAVGDVLPIDQPSRIDLLAGGRRIARLPAARFRPLTPEETP